MKIGIITILRVNNYGAELQAYATQKALHNLGYDAEIIDYLFYKHPKHRKTKQSKPIFNFDIVKKLSETAYPIFTKIKSLKHWKAAKKRNENFELFHKQHTATSPQYQSIDALYAANLNYDIYMVGSDQVWNPGIYSSIAPYFLTFAPRDKRKVAYASSFGVSRIPIDAKAYYSDRLKEFDAIGVRENNAVDLVKELSGKDATWVLDPTLLLNKEEWRSVKAPHTDKTSDYILLYELTPCPYILALAKNIQTTTGFKIVRICKNAAREDADTSIENIIDAGPAEFLSLVDDAKLVITNSFHGSAFAVNFEKDFYTILPQRKANNSRQRSLLQMLGLENRLIEENAPYPNIETLHIDYNKVSGKLEKERAKSINFIKEAING